MSEEYSAGAGSGVLGAWLAAGRLARGYDLTQFASILRLQQFYLEALENEDLDRLPARPYVSGYVRNYALRVNLDPREANRRLQQIWPAELAPIANVRGLEFAEPEQSRWLTMRRAAGVLLLVSIAGYASWYWDAVRDHHPAGLSPVAELESSPPGTGAGSTLAPQSQPDERRVVLGPLAPVALEQMPAEDFQQLVSGQAGGSAAAAFEPLPAGPFPRPRPGTPPALVWGKIYGNPSQAVDDAPEAAEPPSRVAGRAGNPPAPYADGSRLAAYLPKLQLRADLGPLNPDVPPVVMMARGSEPAASAPAREPLNHRRTQAFAAVAPAPEERGAPVGGNTGVVLAASGAASWIEVKDANGKVVVSRLLKDGESVQIPPRDGLRLTTGNAGALVIVMDGTRMPALGGHSAVVRGVALEREALLERRR